MEEKKVGLVPRVVGSGAMGPKEYAVLVTDRRSIFVLELADKTLMGAGVGGLIGAAIASAVQSRQTFDYQNAHPDLLSSAKGSVTIAHEALERMQFKSGALGHRLSIKYRDPRGKTKSFNASILPPPGYVERRKESGMSKKDAIREYAKQVESLYRKALPLTAAMKTEWIP